jgi:hypothetical protein
MPLVIVRAATLGLSGRESPTDLDADRALLQRIESLRQALADIMTGNANPGTMVPDAYMRCAHEALQADDKVAKEPSKQPAPPPPSWTSGTPVSWGK